MIQKGIMEKLRNNKNLAVVLFIVFLAVEAVCTFIAFSTGGLISLLIDVALVVLIILGYFVGGFENVSKLALLGFMAYKLISTTYDVCALTNFRDGLDWFLILAYVCEALAGIAVIAIIVLLVVKYVTNNNQFNNIIILLVVVTGCLLAAYNLFFAIGYFTYDNTTEGVSSLFKIVSPVVLACAFVASFDRANLQFVEAKEEKKESE